MRKLFTLLTVALFATSLWAGLPLTALPTGTNDLSNAQGHLTTWSTTDKNKVIYDDNNYIMMWSNGNNLVCNSNGLGIGNSSKKSAFVFYVDGVSDISVTVWHNGSDATVSLRYMGTTTDVLTDPNGDATGGGTECDQKSITSANTTSAPATLSKSNGAAGYYKVFGTLRFGVKTITITSSTNYTITYDANGGSGTMANSTNIVSACTFTAPEGKEFKEWNTSADGNGTTWAPGATATSDLDLYAIWKVYVPKYTITKGTHTNGDFTISPTSQEAGEEVTLTATPNDGYLFSAWSITKTSDGSATGITVSDSKFTMPAYDVTVNATFDLDPCATYFWFFKAADATTNGITNSTTAFSDMASSGSSLNGSITIDGHTYSVTGRTGDVTSFGNVTIPANKAGTFYGLAVSSGDGTRRIVLTETTTGATYEYEIEGGNTTYRRVEINNIVAGTYSIGKADGNTRMGMAALKACDADYWTVSFNSDGGSAVSSLSVLDGTTARKPADPTKSGYEFAGWYLNDVAYVWSSAVTANIELVAHWNKIYTVSFNAGEGTGEMAALEYTAGTEVTLPACTFTAPTGKEFDAWTSADVTITDNKFTMPEKNVTITATWMTELVRHTVIYKEGNDTVGTEEVVNGESPAEYAKYQTTQLAAYAWCSDAGLENVVAIASAVITKDTTFYAKLTYKYATSINIEQLVWDNGKSYDLVSNLGTIHYATNWTNDLDSLGSVAEKGRNRNYAYLGQKVKAAGKMIDFRLAEGSTVKVKFGNVPDDVKVVINGKDSTVAKAKLSSPFTYTATEDSYLSIRSTTGSTLVFKQIMINEDIKDVVYTINCTAAEHGKDSCSWALAFPGEKVKLIAIAENGYKLDAFSVCKTGDPETTVTVTDSAFTMPAYNVTVSATFVEDSGSGVEEVEAAGKAVKFFENGQMYIRRGEKVYTVTGAEVK